MGTNLPIIYPTPTAIANPLVPSEDILSTVFSSMFPENAFFRTSSCRDRKEGKGNTFACCAATLSCSQVPGIVRISVDATYGSFEAYDRS